MARHNKQSDDSSSVETQQSRSVCEYFARTYPGPLHWVVKIRPLRRQTQPASIHGFRLSVEDIYYKTCDVLSDRLIPELMLGGNMSTFP